MQTEMRNPSTREGRCITIHEVTRDGYRDDPFGLKMLRDGESISDAADIAIGIIEETGGTLDILFADEPGAKMQRAARVHPDGGIDFTGAGR